MNKIFFALGLFMLFISCSPKGRIVAGDPEPPSPPFWYYFTVKGLDSDNDGVRDDVEIWINNYTQEYHYNLALKQFARGQLRVFHVIDYLNAKINREQMRKDSFCLLFVKDVLHPHEQKKVPVAEVLLLRQILNNFWRKNQFNKMGKLIPRGTLDSDFKKENEQFMSCEFKLLNTEKLMRAYVKEHNKNEKLIEAIYNFFPRVKND